MACGNSDNNPSGSQKDSENDFVDYTEEDDTPYVNIPYDMSLIADLYLATDDVSDPTTIYLDAVDGQLYICDILFDQVAYEENVEVNYATNYECYNPTISVEYNGKIAGTEDEIRILTLMTRITGQKNCYLLRSSTDNDLAEYIAAYYIDEVCYLLFFNEEGVAFRIYYMEIEYIEPIFTDGMEFVADDMASYHGFFNGAVVLNVINGQIYNFDYLYKIKYCNAFKINIEWCRENMHFWRTNETGTINSKPNQTQEDVQNAGIELLEKINEENGFYMIYSAEDTPYYEELAVFLIDGEYYFIDITKDY